MPDSFPRDTTASPEYIIINMETCISPKVSIVIITKAILTPTQLRQCKVHILTGLYTLWQFLSQEIWKQDKSIKGLENTNYLVTLSSVAKLKLVRMKNRTLLLLGSTDLGMRVIRTTEKGPVVPLPVLQRPAQCHAPLQGQADGEVDGCCQGYPGQG